MRRPSISSGAFLKEETIQTTRCPAPIVFLKCRQRHRNPAPRARRISVENWLARPPHPGLAPIKRVPRLA